MSSTGKIYEWLKFEGPISVVPVTPEELKGEDLLVYLLMGPTGSGKSAFIESLSPDQNLAISKDSLESVTQEVVCYRVVNLTDLGNTILLMDTPGFLDPTLSESRIIAKITNKLNMIRQSTLSVVLYILYFQPITDIRLGGLKRDAVKLLSAFAESFEAYGITVTTTMWNHISTPKQINDANFRFSCLENEIFKDSDGFGIDILKFEFSLDSALSILDMAHYGWYHGDNKSQKMDPQYQSLILNNLIDRITNTQLQLQILAEDKQNATTPGREDSLLLEVVLRDEKAAFTALQSFFDDLQSFLDDMYEKDPQSCLSPFPRQGVNQSPLPPPPSPPPLSPSPSPSKKKALSARLKTFTSPIKKIFKKL